MKSLGFDFLYIGFLLALYAVISGSFNLLATKQDWSYRRIVIGILLFGCIPLFLIDRMSSSNAALLVAMLAVAEGLANIFFERLIARVTKDSLSISTDIAVLHVPYRAGEFILLASLGFIVGVSGFYAAFLGVAISLALFALLSARFLQQTETYS